MNPGMARITTGVLVVAMLLIVLVAELVASGPDAFDLSGR